MRRLACIAPLIAALALPAAAASAGGTRTHRVQDFDDFDFVIEEVSKTPSSAFSQKLIQFDL